ncbi:MAG: CRISPR-associated helicase Cas3' [Ruminococcaceae bacterium]|nr:CRISPR-associated helicase Cas3' [Oscillospiraceae bacterium]
MRDDIMQYYAHRNQTGEMQSVREHLENVALMASQFSAELLRSIAYETGKAHDIGKYSQAFQERLFGGQNRFEHSTCGALECDAAVSDKSDRIIAPMMEYCIAGHHTGIPDGGTAGDHPFDDTTLHSRLKRSGVYADEKNSYSAYKNEIDVCVPKAEGVFKELMSAAKSGDKTGLIETYAFFTRYLFSCLTDADFLDTERFCLQGEREELTADFEKMKDRLDEKFASFCADTPLKQARGWLQEQACKNCSVSEGISILNMPTGSGKTLCSMKIALKKLLESGGRKKRIIYVIPYTSIIEQTADIFESIFGECADILQHHSNYCIDDSTADYETAHKLRLASENWDAPIIITTSVRFFESMYHNRGSALRRLHNTADSVIIFDEIHLLPIQMLQPCLRGIGYITKYLNSEAILLSATMPDYADLIDRFMPDCRVSELLPDKEDFTYFRKCRYIDLGKTDYGSVLEKAAQYTSSLIIVNLKSTAREIYGTLQGEKYHLSTYMTASDRSETIKRIRQALTEGRRITVVSTSLIEAGVDFDFEAVFRQCAGLDSILQSGGRCNREGKRECGDVYVFETDEKSGRDLQVPINIVKNLLAEHNDISSLECIEEYYRRLFSSYKEDILKNTIADGCTGIDSIPFRSYAESFRFIKDDTVGVVVPHCSDAQELVQALKNGSRSVVRRLQKYTVALRRSEFDRAMKSGIVDDFGTGIYILTAMNCYNSETGLDTEASNDIIL